MVNGSPENATIATVFKKILDAVTGGSVLASGAKPPASVTNFIQSEWHTLCLEQLSYCTGAGNPSLCTLVHICICSVEV